MARKPRRYRAWQQGELDGLCGIYAIVNALAAIMPEEFSERTHSEKLFQALVTRANTLYGVHNIIAHGLNTEDLIPLIKHAQKFIKTYYKLTIRVDRPLRSNPSRSVNRCMDVLRAALVKPNVALILGIDGIFHWSTADKITEKTVELRDSDKMHRLSIAKFRIGGSKGKYRLCKTGVFRLTRITKSRLDAE